MHKMHIWALLVTSCWSETYKKAICFSDHSEDGSFFEGDISGVKLTTASDDGVISKNAIKNTYQRWPGGEIPYLISNSFGSHERSVIRAAMEQFSRHSCVKWRPHMPTDIDYVHILRDQGCHSRVGRTGRAQILSLGNYYIN